MFRGSNGESTLDTGLRGDSGDAWCVYDVTAGDNRFMIDTSGNVKMPNDGVKITATQTAFISTSGFCGELISKYSDTSTATIKADAEL